MVRYNYVYQDINTFDNIDYEKNNDTYRLRPGIGYNDAVNRLSTWYYVINLSQPDLNNPEYSTPFAASASFHSVPDSGIVTNAPITLGSLEVFKAVLHPATTIVFRDNIPTVVNYGMIFDLWKPDGNVRGNTHITFHGFTSQIDAAAANRFLRGHTASYYFVNAVPQDREIIEINIGAEQITNTVGFLTRPGLQGRNVWVQHSLPPNPTEVFKDWVIFQGGNNARGSRPAVEEVEFVRGADNSMVTNFMPDPTRDWRVRRRIAYGNGSDIVTRWWTWQPELQITIPDNNSLAGSRGFQIYGELGFDVYDSVATNIPAVHIGRCV